MNKKKKVQQVCRKGIYGYLCRECNLSRSIIGSSGGALLAINQARLRSSRTRVIFKIACTILCV